VCEVGVDACVALALPFTSEAPRVQHLCADCAIKMYFQKGELRAWHKALQIGQWPQLCHIRCAFLFISFIYVHVAMRFTRKVPTHL